jgi:hypothetical protein
VERDHQIVCGELTATFDDFEIKNKTARSSFCRWSRELSGELQKDIFKNYNSESREA